MFALRVITLGFLFLSTVAISSKAVDERTETAVSGPLDGLDALYADMLPWVAQLHDPASGGFYETMGLKLGREERPYAPDIQSTHFAVNLFRDCGLLETMPPRVREGLVDYFESRRLADGHFADPDYPEMRENARIMGRALMFARISLRSLQTGSQGEAVSGTASKTEPGDGKTGKTASKDKPAPTPAHIASKKAFREWLDARPWGDAWTALDHVSSQANLIQSQPAELREVLTDEALRNVAARQDPRTGLIGGGGLIGRISGAFKLAMFCDMLKRPMPGADALWDTVLGWYRSGPKTDKIFLIRNPAELLTMLSRMTGRRLTAGELSLVLAVSCKELSRYRQADGGFSSFDGEYYIGPNDLYMKPRLPAKAGPQGDMNGTASAWVLRRSLYRLAGIPVPRLAVPADYWARF
jgi:hypothetical protein